MKKIMFMLLFIIGCMTSLAALDVIDIGGGGGLTTETDGSHIKVIAHGEEDKNMAIAVNILHKDSLMRSSKEFIDHEIKNKLNGVVCDIVGVSPYPIFKIGWQSGVQEI